MQPIIKWAGGKRRFSSKILKYLGEIHGNYYEPFLGGGAVLMELEPINAICGDNNEELINFYNVVKKSPQKLISELEKNFVNNHCKDFYYYIRSWDRDPNYLSNRTKVERAARFLYLNKTCYNGLWRVNAKGQNNVPYGKYVNPTIYSEDQIINASKMFITNNIKFKYCDYKKLIKDVKVNDVIYFDPPYDIEEGQNGFVSYTRSGFSRKDQIELRNLCNELICKGAIVGISNSNTDFIKDLYKGNEYVIYDIYEDMKVNRTIGAQNTSRKEVYELFIVGKKRYE